VLTEATGILTQGGTKNTLRFTGLISCLQKTICIIPVFYSLIASFLFFSCAEGDNLEVKQLSLGQVKQFLAWTVEYKSKPNITLRYYKQAPILAYSSRTKKHTDDKYMSIFLLSCSTKAGTGNIQSIIC
jgi:hypothetical protein